MLIAAVFALASQVSAWAQQPEPVEFVDVTTESGIRFVHTDGSYGQYFLFESMSAGLALLDYDNDGRLDIYFLNGARVTSETTTGPDTDVSPASNALYRNSGQLHFAERTRLAGVADLNMSLGVAVADYNNDGFADIYLSNYGSNVLFCNNGDGTFSDHTAFGRVANDEKVGGGTSFFDMDGDGDLDLYAGNYIQFDLSKHKVHQHKGLPAYPSPLSYRPESDTLFENLGDGTFRDVSQSSGIRKVSGRSMGLITFDFDNDNDIDIFVANDTQENHLFQNDGHGIFEETGLLAGLAFDFSGKAQASMGVAQFDFNQDDLPDLFVTSFSDEFVTLYENLGGFFDDVTLRTGTSRATFPHVTWGIVAQDFNNDGLDDVFVATGDLDDQRDERGGASSATGFEVPNLLFLQSSNNRFAAVSEWGTGAAVARSTRGVVAGDLDDNGTIDLVCLNARAEPTLLKNTAAANHFVQVQVVGRRANRDGLGAVVRVTQGTQHWTKHVRSGHSYQSDVRGSLHFGLPSDQPIQVDVRWPDGTSSRMQSETNQTISIIQP